MKPSARIAHSGYVLYDIQSLYVTEKCIFTLQDWQSSVIIDTHAILFMHKKITHSPMTWYQELERSQANHTLRGKGLGQPCYHF